MENGESFLRVAGIVMTLLMAVLLMRDAGAVLVPLHPLTLLLWSVHMVIRNVLGHAGFELMPPGFARGRRLGWLATTTRGSGKPIIVATGWAFAPSRSRQWQGP
jgi:hypothetical protein